MKTLRPGELRFIAKQWNKKLWGVYDTARGSWPVRSPELGIVKQPEELELKTAAELEAERLNEAHPVREAAAPAKKTRGSKKSKQVQAEEPTAKSSSKKAEQPPALEITEEDIQGYDDIDPETAEKYVEGIL